MTNSKQDAIITIDGMLLQDYNNEQERKRKLRRKVYLTINVLLLGAIGITLAISDAYYFY